MLEKGESLTECLTQFFVETGIRTAWIQGLGAALEVTLGYYNLTSKAYQWRDFKGPFELTSLQGNAVTAADGPALHLHATLADRQYVAFGGHVKHLIVGGTCELHIQPLDAKLTRIHDEASGLSLLGPVTTPPHYTV